MKPSNRFINYPSKEEQESIGFLPAIVEEILYYIFNGTSLKDAANLVGMVPEYVNDWYHQDLYGFKKAVDSAITQNKLVHINRIHSDRNQIRVNASKWFLERKYKDDFGKEINIHVNHVLIDSTAKAVIESAIKFIKDPIVLEEFAKDLKQRLALIKINNDTVKQLEYA